jgi:hypothetical protein
MKRLSFVLAVLAALALPAAAAAKGPDHASISGPGLTKPVVLGGNGEATGTALGQLAMLAGFFPAAFQESPDPMLDRAPTKQLGPKYRVRYRVPGPDNRTFWIDAELYPYAKGGALTHTKPGQRIFGMQTRGGWFPGGTRLRLALLHAGLPARAPSGSSASGTNAAFVAGIAVPGALALAAAGLLYRRRREPA